MQPVVANLERKCSGNITFIHADVDQRQYRQLASQYRVSAIPRYVLLDASGKTVSQWVGMTNEKEFDKAMAKICAGNP